MWPDGELAGNVNQMENQSMAETTKPQQLKIATEHGDITVEMWPDVAPKTVENFIALARKGFYNGLTFHRIIPGFMIQGGCPQGTGIGGPGYTIKAEFSNRKHARGVISMARSQDPNSAGSQFFIMHEAAPHLDGQYTCFGHVTAGIEVVDKIAATPLRDPGSGKPVKAPKITSITAL
jgi:peptidyl-prolyl cis-trans isomerase B (cyclophilin B)